MEKWLTLKNSVLTALAAVGGGLAGALGGWDTALKALVWFMAADYLTGLMVAGFFRRSDKSESGGLDSHAGFLGLCRKGAVILAVLVAARLDTVTGGSYIRSAVIFFFLGNEGLSILENLGLMGVPYPEKLKKALNALRDKNES